MKKKMIMVLGICLCMAMSGCNAGEKNAADVNSVVTKESVENKQGNINTADSNEDKAEAKDSTVEIQGDEVETKGDIVETKGDIVETKDDLVGCDQNAVNNDEKNKASVEMTNMSDDLYDYQIELNGRVINLPISVKELNDMGFTYENKNNGTLPANHVVFGETIKDDKCTFIVSLANFDINELPFEECYVYSIKAEEFYLKKNQSSARIAKGIEQGVSTKEEVEAAFGMPSKTTESKSSVKFQYVSDRDSSVEFRFDAENGNVLKDIEITNCVKPKNFSTSKVDTTKVPKVTEAYVAPTAYSEDLMDYVFAYGDAMYKLPVPVSEFLVNGWTIKKDVNGGTIAGDGYGRIDLTRDNQKATVTLKNYSDEATTVENCFVTAIEASIYGCDVEMKLSDNIYKGMSEEELEKALEGYTVNREETKNLKYISVYSKDTKLDGYTFTIKDGTVITIKAAFQPKQKKLLEMYNM